MDSLETLREKVRAAPGSTAFVELAHALCEHGLHEEAEVVCRRGLELRPDIATAYVALGRALVGQGKLDDAETLLRSTVEIHPGYAAAYRWLAEVYVARGEPERAKAVLSEAAGHAPSNRHVATVLEESGRIPVDPSIDGESTKLANRPLHSRRMGEAASEEPTVRPPSRQVPPVGAASPPPSREQPRIVSREVRAIPVDAAPTATPAPRPPTPAPAARTPTPISGAAPLAATDKGRTSSISLPLPVTTTPPPPVVQPRSWVGPVAIAFGVVGAFAVWMVMQNRNRGDAVTDEAAITARNAVDGAFADPSLDRLVAARGEARRALGQVGNHPTLAPAVAFLEAFLARRHAVAYDADAQALVEVMGDERLAPERAGELAAARALLFLGRSNVSAALHHARQGAKLAPGRPFSLLALAMSADRAGEAAEAARAYGTLDEKHPRFVAGVRLAAEHWIDIGDPRRAAASMRYVLERAPQDLESRLILDEALHASAAEAPAGHARALTAGCAKVGPGSTALLTACGLGEAARLRAAGRRDTARARVIEAARVAPDDPRLLGRAAQLLANLGEITRAAELAKRAERLAGVATPVVAWAIAAVDLGQGRAPRAGAGAPVGTTESRLIAMRAIAASKGGPGIIASLRSFNVRGELRDADFEWYVRFGRLSSRTPEETPQALIDRAGEGGPVGAYIAGILEHQAGRPRQAAAWLARALSGHGDSCRAGQLYVTVLRDLNTDASTDPRIVTLRSHGCTLTP